MLADKSQSNKQLFISHLWEVTNMNKATYWLFDVPAEALIDQLMRDDKGVLLSVYRRSANDYKENDTSSKDNVEQLLYVLVVEGERVVLFNIDQTSAPPQENKVE